MTGWRAYFCAIAGLPFLCLAAGAMAGCLLGQIPGVGGGLWAFLACGLALPAFWAARRHLRVALALLLGAVAAGFAARAVWTGEGSPGARLARAFPGPVLAEARLRVASPPIPVDEKRSRFFAEVVSLTLGDSTAPARCRLLVRWTGPAPEVGDDISAIGTFSAISPPRNPGEFDRRSWLARQGVFSEMVIRHPSDGRILRVGAPSIRRLAARAAKWIRGTLTAGLDPASSQARLIIGMTLGETRDFDEADRGAFRSTGTLHLFSVSGLHVGMLGLLLWMILGGVPPEIRASLIIPALFFYALVTGWNPASVRAAIMAAFVLAGLVVRRPSLLLNNLLAAAVFILARNPAELLNPGFQMSFAAVLALILLCPPLTRALGAPFAVDPFLPRRLYSLPEILRLEAGRRLAPSLAVVVAAWIGSLVLTGIHFHILSLSAMPANALCVPIAFCVMAVSTMSLTFGVFSSALATIFNNANWLLSSILLGIVHVFAGIPGSTIPLALPGSHRGEVVVFDLGSGAATAFDIGGRVALVDAGAARDARSILEPWLDQRGITRIESLTLTHGDARHVGGAEELLRRFRVGRLYDNVHPDRSPVLKRALQFAASRGVPVERIAEGDVLSFLPGAPVECLFPPKDHIATLADDRALVLKATLRGWRILFLSDAGPKTLLWLAERYSTNLACDIVIQGAHRSGVADPESFWRLAAPQAVIASNARFPASERIPQETLHMFERLGIALLPLDRTGAVSLQIGESSVRMTPFLREPALTLVRERLPELPRRQDAGARGSDPR